MKLFRILLFPIAILYGLITSIRNGLFDIKVFKGQITKVSSIGVGNLSSGGTGKSIIVDYLISIYQTSYSVAVLSRGYGRKSTGFKLANSYSSAIKIGDEPFQYFKKYSNIKVAVGEDRINAVNKILEQYSKINLILFDDIMQHRWMIPSQLILTTTYSSPFFNDFIIPIGSLREFTYGKKRAQTIVVTKCPSDLSEQNRLDFKKRGKFLSNQDVFFTKINYSKMIVNSYEKLNFDVLKNIKILLVTGIADSSPLVQFLNFKNIYFDHLKYRDHFNYNSDSVKKIKKKAKNSFILTTEKDYGRISPLLKTNKLFYIPVNLSFFSEEEEYEFKKRINSFIKT